MNKSSCHRCLISALSVLLLVSSGLAQRIDIKASPAPHYAGEPVTLQITISDIAKEPQPTCEHQTALPDGIRLDSLGVSPRFSQSIMIINGRRSSKEQIAFRFDYQLFSEKPGKTIIGPFIIQQNGKVIEKTSRVQFEFEEVANDSRMRIKLEMTDQPVYQGQRVPVTVVWSYSGDISQVSNMAIRCELFDLFEFSDPPVTDESTLLPLQTSAGTLKIPATVTERMINGQRFVELSAKRLLLADSPGTFDVGPIRASIRVGARSRDIFDSFFSDPLVRRKPSVPVRAQGQPRRMVIKPIPIDGRPPSFAGAVGTGFHLDVQANRTVVRVGDPISLTISVRGDGNLNQAALPSLSADGGMSPSLFRLPTEDISGVYHDGQRQFTVPVRVEDESVSEIPPLAFSWFNPLTEQYETTRSAPVALQVMPAQVVSSADVVSAAAPAEPSMVQNDSSTSQPNLSVNDRTAAIAGADLAIETDMVKLSSGGPSRWVQSTLATAMYGFGLAAVAGALVDQRWRQINPAILQRKRLLAQQSKRIRAAANQPAGQAAETVADALRLLLPETDADLRREAEALIARLETIIYAPEDQRSVSLDGELLGAARLIAQRVSEGSV